MIRHPRTDPASARLRRAALTPLAAAILLAGAPGAGAQEPTGPAMPGAAQMSGVPLPAGDLPNGAISVRLIRGDVSQNLTGHPVELHGGPGVLSLTTDDSGRALFVGLAPGTAVHALAVVDGTRLESQTFPVPSAGGIKVMLVAPDAAMAARAAEDAALAASPAQPGVVVLGGESQFIVELEDDTLQVYYLLQIANNARAPVATAEPLVFDLPSGARGATVLEGSSPLAGVAGPRLTVRGPFPPGKTIVHAAYQLPYRSSGVRITQRLPATLERLSLVVEKVGAMHLESAQMASHGDMPADGKAYLVANGPAIAAGQTLDFTITGLPYRATWPTTLALALAVVILGAGVWAATGSGARRGDTDARRRTLQGRRDRLFADLVRLEAQHRNGQVDEHRYATRRRELVGQLEKIYSELDQGLAA